jgi:hypothetical protein
MKTRDIVEVLDVRGAMEDVELDTEPPIARIHADLPSIDEGILQIEIGRTKSTQTAISSNIAELIRKIRSELARHIPFGRGGGSYKKTAHHGQN